MGVSLKPLLAETKEKFVELVALLVLGVTLHGMSSPRQCEEYDTTDLDIHPPKIGLGTIATHVDFECVVTKLAPPLRLDKWTP